MFHAAGLLSLLATAPLLTHLLTINILRMFITGAATKSETPKEDTTKENADEALLSPEDYSNADAFIEGFQVGGCSAA